MKILNFINLNHNCSIYEKGEIICLSLDKNEFDSEKIEIYFDNKNKFIIDLNKIIEYNYINIGNSSRYQYFLKIQLGTSFNSSWVLGINAFKGNFINFCNTKLVLLKI